jgi:hypothetical protein
MEATGFSKTLVRFYQTTWHHTLQDYDVGGDGGGGGDCDCGGGCADNYAIDTSVVFPSAVTMLQKYK